MKRWLLASAVIAVVLCGAAGLAFRHTHTTPPPEQPLSILFTCDVHGRLVPCGCFSGQLGGLTRIATLFGKGASPGFLKLDVGNAIAGTADYDQIQYRYLQRAFGAMGYEALNAGQGEAGLSAAQLHALKAGSPVTMISANLLDKATHAPVFEPWKIVRQGPWRIAVVGVLDPHGLDETNLGDGLAVEEMDVTLEKILPALHDQADFIVLLAFADETALDNLARQFYELDVILGGRVTQPSQSLIKENRSLILATTNESRAIGILQTRLVAKNRLVAVKGEVQLVKETIPQDEEIAELAKAYRKELRGTKLEVDQLTELRDDVVPGVKPKASYVGSTACASCHRRAAEKWLHTAHAVAFDSLIHAGAEADPNCIGCHTVGFGMPSGFQRLRNGPLVNVGCESCHGPGSQHVEQHTRPGTTDDARFRAISETDCRKCHRGEFSRPFAWAEFWPKIAHGKEPTPN